MLNAIRFGKTNSKITKTFQQLSRLVLYEDGIEPTELFPTKAEVEVTNTRRLSQLDVKSHIYHARDTPGSDSNGGRVTIMQMERLLDRLVALKQLELKVGAQVMLIKNLEQGTLVNGSLGKIVDFTTTAECLEDPDQRSERSPSEDDAIWPVVQFVNGRTKCIFPQEFTIENASGKPEATRVQVSPVITQSLSLLRKKRSHSFLPTH
ncbi:hypothetical protein M378DRAFT_252853 [Amanita muscaria Koide BX008]|uniref:DNA helicase Pif1-like 2B domain-containing protein n=1 Tax=Amanita muscaria (strain Koide BX008) TaxID=946122 RepID=A0A0C2T773_AMAMK|nr:hypothetical protein M378DRAFT_252853 [Amanita muscaria Koide BX008]